MIFSALRQSWLRVFRKLFVTHKLRQLQLNFIRSSKLEKPTSENETWLYPQSRSFLNNSHQRQSNLKSNLNVWKVRKEASCRFVCWKQHLCFGCGGSLTFSHKKRQCWSSITPFKTILLLIFHKFQWSS